MHIYIYINFYVFIHRAFYVYRYLLIHKYDREVAEYVRVRILVRFPSSIVVNNMGEFQF